MLSLITWAPFVGALLIMFTARHRPLAVRLIAAVTTGLSTGLSLWIWVAYDREAAGFQFYEKLPLVPPLGISYELGADGISLLLVLLTSIIIFAGVFASWTVAVRSQEFYALLLTLVTGVFGVFVSLDLFVLFLFYELAVLPMYLLIGIWGSTGEIRPRGIFAWAYRETGVGTKEYAAMKLTLYLLFGSAFILVGIFALYVNAGASSFSFLDLEAASFAPGVQRWVFLAFYVGFGVLAGIWPLHTWSPDGHASAPTAVSMLHAGVLMKLGAYGVVRVGMGLLPSGALDLAWLVGTVGCVNVVYGALSTAIYNAMTGVKDKVIIAPYAQAGVTIYATIKREANGYLLDDSNGTFVAKPADPYVYLSEDYILKGTYELRENRAAWTDGRYIVTIYKQAGASPAPASDTIIESGEMYVVSDAEIIIDASIADRPTNPALATDYTSARAAKLDNLDATVMSRPTLVQIEASDVLAKQAKLDFVEKWILNKLVESPSGTWRLFDDDGVTIVKSWKWDAKTRTRELSL